jgi:hypothetical protein
MQAEARSTQLHAFADSVLQRLAVSAQHSLAVENARDAAEARAAMFSTRLAVRATNT